MTTLTAGVVQCAAAHLDPSANALTTGARIRELAAQGAGLVVLPELIATAYDPHADALAALAESTDDPGLCLAEWSAAARETGCVVVGGFVERDGDALYNSAAVIDPAGTIVEVYRKLHLFGAERKFFAPGNRGLPIVDVAGVRLGVAVCYDLRFPETLRILAVRGCEVVAIPTAWVRGFDRGVDPSGRIGQVDGAVVQANLNQLYLVIADQVGETAGVSFLGRSLIVDPYGTPLVGPLSPEGEETATATLDTEAVAAARHRGPGIDPLVNRRTDVYAEDLGYQPPKGGSTR